MGESKKGKLTPKAEAFCRFRVAGKSQRQAYIAAGYGSDKSSKESKDVSACRIDNRPDIQARQRELQALADAGAILSAQQIQTELSLLSVDQDKPDSVRLKALDQLSRTKGMYTDTVKADISASLTIEDKRALFRDMISGEGQGTP